MLLELSTSAALSGPGTVAHLLLWRQGAEARPRLVTPHRDNHCVYVLLLTSCGARGVRGLWNGSKEMRRGRYKRVYTGTEWKFAFPFLLRCT
jgi:hypothetical protein